MALCIRFYLHEGRQHGHMLLRDWLFETARTAGITGGTAFRACAGFGRHGLHEDHFFELAGDLPETVEFFADQAQITSLLGKLHEAALKLLYITYAVDVGQSGA